MQILSGMHHCYHLLNPEPETSIWAMWPVPCPGNPVVLTFFLPPGRVSDRSDGKLVHLDGLNFSRAWVFYGLAHQYPEYTHLFGIADQHVAHSLPNLVGDSYEGGHWLGSFALYALQLSTSSPSP